MSANGTPRAVSTRSPSSHTFEGGELDIATPARGARDAEVTAALARLTVRERAISRRRRELHVQIDRLYLSSRLDETDVAWLDRLEAAERKLSTQRRRLHGEIDELRARIGLPPWRLYHGLDRAA